MSDQSTPSSPKPAPEPSAAAPSASPEAPAAAAAAQPEPVEPAAATTPDAAATDPAAETNTATEAAATDAAKPQSRWRGFDMRMPNALESRESRQKLAIGVLAVLLALQWWNARTDISDLRRELAQRLQSGENLNTQTKLIANRVDDEVKAL